MKRYFQTEMVWWLLVAIIGLFLVFAVPVKADDASERKQFFHDVKDAIFFDGTRYNCCGEGDATRARIIASHGDMLAVEIIDTMRHPTAKKGEIVNVPRRLIVKYPLSPQKMGTILFLNTVAKNRSPYCLVQQRAGG